MVIVFKYKKAIRADGFFNNWKYCSAIERTIARYLRCN